ncbi:MAG: AAA family ATPase [Desulfitobacteriaceae bacterium]
MRPKLLEIEGLQSFRDVQKIDFDCLGETGLFGIFGPTGSGKSTVLDAITFTLYGKVKRAERGTQGIINTNLKTTKVAFTFELLKDGNRKTYRVERTYQRKKGSDNSCEPKVARLIEVTEVGEIPVCDKAMEVSSSIEELLGLSHDDFTRAVVLPQNSFQEFLLLDNAKKREMLERIFYLEEYGKQLGEKLNRKMSRLKSQIDRLSGELSAYVDASDEAVEEARNAMETATLERAKVEIELKQLEANYNEAKAVWLLVQELSAVNHKELQHLVARETVYIKKVQLEKALKADGLIEMIRNKKELFVKLQKTEKLLQEIMDRLPGVFSSLNETKQKYEALKNEAVIEQPKLVGLKTRLEDAWGIKTEIQVIQIKVKQLQSVTTTLVDQISHKSGVIGKETGEFEVLEQGLSQLRVETGPLKIEPEYRLLMQEGAKLENEVGTLFKNLDELNAKAGALKGVVTGMEQKLDQIKEKLSLSQKALDTRNAEKLNQDSLKPEDRNSVLQYREDLHALQTLYDGLKFRQNELEGMNSKLVKQQSTLKEFAEKKLILEDAKVKAESLHGHLKLELGQAIKALDRNAAYLLSQNLKEGEACPVCGSEHHPHPLALAEGTELSVLERQVENAEKRLVEAEKALKKAETDYLLAGEQIKALNEQINQAAQELELKNKEYKQAQLGLPTELAVLELEKLRVELDRRNNLSAEKLKAIETWEKQQEVYKGEILKLNEHLAKDRLVENGCATELKVNRENREQLEKDLIGVNSSFAEKQQKHLEFLEQHKIKSVAAELKRLAENDRKMNSLQKQMEQTQELLKRKTILLEQLKEELGELNSKNIKVNADCTNLLTQIDDKQIKLKELAGDANIEDEIKRIEQKLEEYSKLDKLYQENVRALENQQNELTNQKSTLDNQRNIYTENYQSDEDKLKIALLDKGFADSDEVEKSIISKETQKALNDEINEYEQTESKIQVQKAIVLKKLDSRSITEEEWNNLSHAYQNLVLFKEECVSRSEVAKNTFKTLKAKHEKWMELNKSYSELKNKNSLLEQIQKLLRAERGKDNSFIDFIAEERLRYVAVKASETLGMMTKYRYALELDTDAGFIIRDNANGGVHRMVTSLSGGETFLTSLSLALALSEQIQLKGQSPLEFFFLDEGFGTLDNNLLDTVIDSLERLSNKERVIGLISHVPELRSRIARRLIVDPPSSSGEGSRVKIEMA